MNRDAAQTTVTLVSPNTFGNQIESFKFSPPLHNHPKIRTPSISLVMGTYVEIFANTSPKTLPQR